MNYFKPNKTQQIAIKPMMQGASCEDLLSQSIVQIVKNPGNSSVIVKNQNNNSIPTIQTGMLYSFNPTAFDTFRRKQAQQTPVSPSTQHGNKPGVNINFSNINNNYHQNFTRHPPLPAPTNNNNFQSIYQNRQIQQQPPHIGHGNNRSHSMNIIRPYGSIISIPQNTPSFNQTVVQSNRPSFQRGFVSQPFAQIQRLSKQSSLRKSKLVGNKPRVFESINQNQNQHRIDQQIKMNLFPVCNNSTNNREKELNETSFEVVQSPAKNMSSISIQRSQYVLMPENRVEKGDVEVEQKSSNESSPQPNTASNPINLLSSPVKNNTSMIFSIQQEPQSAARNANQTPNRSIQPLSIHNNQSPKSSPKFDNNAYLHQQKQLPQSSMATMIQKLQSRESRLSVEQQIIGRASKLSRMVENKGEVKKQQQHEQQMEVKQPVTSVFKQSQFEQHQHQSIHHDQQQRIATLQRTHNEQKCFLLQRISTLQASLIHRQQQNTTLKFKLQNQQLSKTLQSQYQRLQIASKLNEVEIKRLRNEIMMFKIKQRLYRNREKELRDMVNELKEEVKVARMQKSAILNSNNNNTSELGFARSKVYQY